VNGRQWALTVVVALISSGLWPFLSAMLKRRPEIHRLDAETTSITVQGAETTVTVLMRSLERAENREAALEVKLAAREAKIEELESRLDHLSLTLRSVTAELEDARRQLATIRE
jgi:chromosome segregation ATPase